MSRVTSRIVETGIAFAVGVGGVTMGIFLDPSPLGWLGILVIVLLWIGGVSLIGFLLNERRKLQKKLKELSKKKSSKPKRGHAQK